MMTTPNPTAERVIAEAMVNAGAPLMHSRVEESVAAALRAHGLLSEGAPSEEHPEFCYCGQILKREDKIDFYTLKCPKLQCGGFRMVPKRSAGGTPQEPSAVTDINGHSWMTWEESGKNGTYCRSCGGWAGKVGNRQCSPAPQVPNQNETKSGNNFVSLDPEKVAEVERAAAARALEEAADGIESRRNEPGLVHLDIRYAGYYTGIRSGMESDSKALRARAAEIREGERHEVL